MGNTVNQSIDNGNSTDNWDPYSNYGDGGSDYSTQDPSQDFSQDDWTTIYPADGSQDQAPALTVDSERQKIEQMEADPKLSAAARDQLRALQGKLNTLVSETGDQLANDLSDIETTLSGLSNPTPENQKPLDEQLQDYLTAHPDLGKDKQKQIKKWIAAYQLDPESTKSQIKSEFKSLTQQVGNSEVYGGTIAKLATVTGMKAADISDTFAKLQIKDPNHLTDDQIAQLLPKLGGKPLDAARKQVAKAQSSLQDEITSAQQSCDKVNGDKKNTDFSSFKTLLDISKHTDPASLKLSDALQAEAKATIPVLSVLKGVPEDKISVMGGAPKDKSSKSHNDAYTLAGSLKINGKEVNVVGNIRTGEIDFNNHANAWPKVSLHDYKLNTIGKEASLPSWVDDYPCIPANSGGNNSGKVAAEVLLGPIGFLL